ncbi:uncharacterized protein AB675_8894 [Cyphellophora attinorum]|uniref:Uncharacterized protein n=1 Tax=Cyphellophora attinorum TaxID=1664694 RepID=A0A0N0NIU5_9EURO|nr:uncharacterized protein AB675_8894 [Phialophora attinorum]KPI36148.1 hypothetical protein AB675_8894 [Phialophora attinorum]
MSPSRTNDAMSNDTRSEMSQVRYDNTEFDSEGNALVTFPDDFMADLNAGMDAKKWKTWLKKLQPDQLAGVYYLMIKVDAEADAKFWVDMSEKIYLAESGDGKEAIPIPAASLKEQCIEKYGKEPETEASKILKKAGIKTRRVVPQDNENMKKVFWEKWFGKKLEEISSKEAQDA